MAFFSTMKVLLSIFAWIFFYIFIMIFSVNELMINFNYNDNVQLTEMVKASEIPTSYPTTSIIDIQPDKDIRELALNVFLLEIKSPLADYIEDIVKAADQYSIDYALVPAISMQESNGCKVIPEGSYNCWGLGIYGSKVLKFNSFPEAIQKVSKIIKESYIKKGLTNPTLLEDKWTPSSEGIWSYAVNYYLIKIHNIERNLAAS